MSYERCLYSPWFVDIFLGVLREGLTERDMTMTEVYGM